MTRVIHETVESTPFFLRDRDNSKYRIIVTEATEAEGFMEELEVTHNEFHPANTPALQAGIDRLFGEVKQLINGFLNCEVFQPKIGLNSRY